MSWLRVDDLMAEHGKWEALEDDAERWGRAMSVWLAAGCYCSKLLTDGRISAARLRRLTPYGADALEAAADLVAAGFWEEDGSGYVFHDWADCNPMAADVLAKRRAEAERKRESRRVSARTSGRTSNGTYRRTGARTSDGSPGRSPATPTRPDPARPQLATQASGAGASLGSELADAAMAELRSHPVLAIVATEDMAQALAMVAVNHRKAPSQVRAAIAAVAGKVATGKAAGEPVEAANVASRLEGMVRNWKGDGRADRPPPRMRKTIEMRHGELPPPRKAKP